LRIHIQSGTFIKYYFKPLNMMFYYMSEMIDLKGFAQLVFAIIILVTSSLKLGIAWGPLQILQLILMVITASLIMISLLTMAACSAFWITNSFSVMSLVTRLRDFSRYPMTIFNSVFRFLFTWILPIGFIAFYPVRAIIHPDEAGSYIYFTPLAGAVLFALTILVWNRGVRNYNGTGS
jgi:ABC-2 type transport system permease protein